MRVTMRRFGLAVAVLGLMAGAAEQARATLIVYENFDYQPGPPLLGMSGGVGFAGPWRPGAFNASNVTNYTVASGSLAFDGLLTSGNSVDTASLGTIGGIVRDLSSPLLTGTTAYLSVLLRPEGTLDQGALNGFFGLYLNSSRLDGIDRDLFIGKPGTLSEYVQETRGNFGRVSSGVPAVVGEAALLVLKLELLPDGPNNPGGFDRSTLYVNPTPGGPEPTSGAVKFDRDVDNITGLSIYSTGAFRIDEIRLGDTFADVTPIATAAVPEPYSLALAVTGALFGLGAWLRKRRRATA